MDHVELTPYPFPNGVTIPRLMPYQEYPWNGDGYLAAEVLRLKEAHGLKDAIETGTCLGSTTCWLAEQFSHVTSIELVPSYADIARARLEALPEVHNRINATVLVGSSVDELSMMLGPLDDGTNLFVFLDAHWGQHCPLLEELHALYFIGAKPCIVIHDFQVPEHPEMGFDKMPDGRPFNLELIQDHCDRIYGQDKWKYNYPKQVEGANRGWISIEPC